MYKFFLISAAIKIKNTKYIYIIKMLKFTKYHITTIILLQKYESNKGKINVFLKILFMLISVSLSPCCRLLTRMGFSPAGFPADGSSLCSSSAAPTLLVRYLEPSCGSADSGWTAGEQKVAPPIGENWYQLAQGYSHHLMCRHSCFRP